MLLTLLWCMYVYMCFHVCVCAIEVCVCMCQIFCMSPCISVECMWVVYMWFVGVVDCRWVSGCIGVCGISHFRTYDFHVG